jgi:hypothetical protein
METGSLASVVTLLLFVQRLPQQSLGENAVAPDGRPRYTSTRPTPGSDRS